MASPSQQYTHRRMLDPESLLRPLFFIKDDKMLRFNDQFHRQPYRQANFAPNSPLPSLRPRIIYPSTSISRTASSQSPPTPEVDEFIAYQTSLESRRFCQDTPRRVENRESRRPIPVQPRPVEIHADATIVVPDRNGGPPGHNPNSTRQSPSHGDRYAFITVDPSTKASNGVLSYVRSRCQTEEDRRYKRMLKEKGGSCIWCAQRRKPCDLEKVCVWCKQNGLPCLRSSDQIGLYSPVEPSTPGCRQAAISRAKHNTFVRANKLLKEFRAWLSSSNFVVQNPSARVILNIERDQPDSSGLVLLNPIHSDLPQREAKSRLLNSIGQAIPFPLLHHAGHRSEHYDIFLMATNIFRSVSFLISITCTGLHILSPYYDVVKTTSVDLLVSLAKLIAQLTDDFGSKLCARLRPSKSKPIPQNINIAVNVYHQVLVALQDFQPGGVIQQIFSGILAQVPSSLSLIERLLSVGHFSNRRMAISPLLVPNSFHLAMYLRSGDKKSVSTAIECQVASFGIQNPKFTLSQLLTCHDQENPLVKAPAVCPSHAQIMTLRHPRDKACAPPSDVDVEPPGLEPASSGSSRQQTLGATDSSPCTSVDDDRSDFFSFEQEPSVEIYFKTDEFIRDLEAGVCGAKGGLSVDSGSLGRVNPHLQTPGDLDSLT
ncbi:hypothetical protein EMPG_16803 [Blastomyces silverae]|uniref:Zn(2)-C6 fungal-type domain-containing protein n=1 Tax=Blastomyces silverae TaxID=2060906 RepID=A0A0H1B9E0_9EURO|nr:hypothetical protein EMPG_16803 [Blastomyces silverae]